MMSTTQAFFGLVTALSIGSCQTLANEDDFPALISNPTAESRAELQAVLNNALNLEVTVADDALTSSNMLIIERRPPRGMQSQPATGRNMEPPIRFQLVLNGSDCILIDTRDATRHLLENTTCVAE